MMEQDATSHSERQGQGPADSVFLAMLAHELRSPMTAIRGNAHVLRRNTSKLTKRQRQESLEDICDAADRLDVLLDGLMMLADATVHGTGVELTPVAVEDVVRQVVARHARLHAARDVVIRAPHTALALGVRRFIEEMVENLLANAFKYSPPAETVEVEISLENDLVCVRVLDRGVGVEPDEVDRLFDGFYRSTRIATHQPGTGIGLFVLRRLADAQGGRVWARPRSDGGSEFGFALQRSDLPRRGPGADAAGPQSVDGAGATSAAQPAGGGGEPHAASTEIAARARRTRKPMFAR